MLRRNLGLTKFYNLINDSTVRGDKDVDRLREMHVETDTAAMAAYGWEDIPTGHGFHAYRQVERWGLVLLLAVRAWIGFCWRIIVRAASEQGASGAVPAPFEVPIEEGTLFSQ